MTSSRTFTYDGLTVPQSFTVPWHVPGSLTVEVRGAQGGQSLGGWGADGTRSGPQGRIAGILDVDPLTVLSIIVGGTPAIASPPTAGVAGWLGGDGGGNGGSGGGATAVIDGAALLIVAGGGAGVGVGDSNSGGSGGYGISNGTGGDGPTPAGPGTLTGPGAGDAGGGHAGVGHNGGDGQSGSGGGGGAGYYGGGGGRNGRNGGGGSSWADTAVVSSITVPATGSARVVFTWEPADPPPPGGWSVGFLKF